VLVDEQNCNVLALARELVKGGFDGLVIRLRVDYEEVLLAVWWWGDVLGVLSAPYSCTRLGKDHTPTPARSMPVTVSCTALAFPPAQPIRLGFSDLIANHSKELPVFILRRRCCCHGQTCIAALVGLREA
jgi:hypothetical protein